MTIAISTKGQITLPKKIRNAHNLQSGDEVEIISINDIIQILPRNRSVKDLFGSLSHFAGNAPLADESAEEVLAQVAAKDDNRIKREWHNAKLEK